MRDSIGILGPYLLLQLHVIVRLATDTPTAMNSTIFTFLQIDLNPYLLIFHCGIRAIIAIASDKQGSQTFTMNTQEFCRPIQESSNDLNIPTPYETLLSIYVP